MLRRAPFRVSSSSSTFASSIVSSSSSLSLAQRFLSAQQQQQYEQSQNFQTQQQQQYANAEKKPMEGRKSMSGKIHQVVSEGEMFASAADASGIRAAESDGRDADNISPAPSNLDTSNSTPGDTFGTYETRQPFLRPVHRNVAGVDHVEFAELFPPDAPPERCVSPRMLRRLSGRYGLTPKQVLHRMIDCNHDINLFLHKTEIEKPGVVSKNDYGVVALEAYDPETFCLVNYTLPSFEATRDPQVLEALHELTLSAAEIPVDTPRNQVIDRFLRDDWTTEWDEKCCDIVKHLGAGVRDVLLLPYGEYSSQGFYIAHPISADFPNIGTGAAATCYDLRSGIHARFRFHAERNADSLAEHLVREQMHFDQYYVHFLRQSFWFSPDYSVEDFIRFKESLLMPSATIFEMRTAVMLHNVGGSSAYRNVAEIEKVKVAQHKLEKGGKEQAMAGNLQDSTGMSKVIAAMKSPHTSQYANNSKEKDNYKEIRLENKVFEVAEV